MRVGGAIDERMTDERGQGADPGAVHCILHEGVITFVSANSLEVGGFPAEHFHGRVWSEIVHPDDRAVLMQFAAPRWEGIIDAVFRVQEVDGSWTWRRAEGVRTLDADGPSTIVTLRQVEAPATTD